MKALIEKRIRALELRRQGKSYSQIKSELIVSKSSLSLWLRDHPLPLERIRELRDWNAERIENCRNTKQRHREERLKLVYDSANKTLLPLTKKELFLTGLFLYWGEGGKTQRFGISLSNTNPKVIKFYIKWLVACLGVSREKMKVRLHLYKDMSVNDEIAFWSSELGMSRKNFGKPYIKSTTLRGLTFKGIGHGTCNLVVNGRDYYEKTMMSLQAVVDHYV